MASFWNQLVSLFGNPAPTSPAAGASLYGQPIPAAALPPAAPAPDAPDAGNPPGMGLPTAAMGLPQRQAADPASDPSSGGPQPQGVLAGLPQRQAPADPQASGFGPSTAAAALPQRPSPPPSKAVHSWLVNALDQGLLGGGISRHDQQAFDAAQIGYAREQAQRFSDTLPDDRTRNAFWANPAEFVKNWDENLKPQKYAEGEAGVTYGDAAHPFYAPKTVSDNGRVLSVTPTGAKLLGDTGPSFNADGVDTRGLAPQANFNRAVPLESATFNSGGTYRPGAPSAAAGLPQLPSPTAGAPAALGGAQGAGPAQTRGQRNNNPGNVRALQGGQKWQGQTGVDDQGYATFDTPQNGVRATLLNLQNYQQLHGVNTPASIAARWAPAGDGNNNPAAYGKFIAQQMGIGVNDPIDLQSADGLGKTAQAIFAMENGHANRSHASAAPAPLGVSSAASGLPQRGAEPSPAIVPAPALVTGLPQKGQAPTGEATIVANARTRQLTPDEVKARGFAPGAVAFLKPNGDVDVKSGSMAWTPADVRETRKATLDSPEYREAKSSILAYNALKANAGALTGPSAYNILDTWIRTINPGASAKQGNIAAAMEEMGVPAELIGIVQHLGGKGKLPLDIQQKILDGVLPFVQNHWAQADALNQQATQNATAHGYKPEEVTAPLEAKPDRFVIPDPDAPAGPARLDPKNPDADYARLKSGTQFIGPDGKVRTKP